MLTLKQVEWFGLWWREVFIYLFFPAKLSVDLRWELVTSQNVELVILEYVDCKKDTFFLS